MNAITEPSESERNTLLIAYVLFFAVYLTGGVAGVAGVIVCHLKIADSTNEFLRSHYRWLIRTFWFAVLWTAVSVALMFTIILIPVCYVGLGVIWLWHLYRLVRGAINYAERRPLPV